MDGALKEILATEIPLGVLTDLVSFALPMEFQQKRDLLGECDIDKRATMLLSALDAKGPWSVLTASEIFQYAAPFQLKLMDRARICRLTMPPEGT